MGVWSDLAWFVDGHIMVRHGKARHEVLPIADRCQASVQDIGGPSGEDGMYGTNAD
jgi:hypothetical protein